MRLHQCTPLTAISQTLSPFEASGPALLLETVVGEGDARTRDTPPRRGAGLDRQFETLASFPASGTLCSATSALSAVMMPLTGCAAPRVDLRRVLATATAAVVSRGEVLRCDRHPEPAHNIGFTRRGLRPLVTAGVDVGLS
jgi:hypothetical protein